MSDSPPSQERRIAELDENIERIFEIRKRLGKGAYGIVWKATDRRTNETIALKKIFDAFRDETDAQRTYREIVFLRAFQSHPNIIRMLDIYKAANNLDFYLVFEYMDSDLHNVIKKGDILKDVHKRFVMYQLLNAIKFMHSGNVIHRDLKPSNILIDTKCRLKVADFGLARTIGVKRPKTETGDAKDDMNQEGILTDYVATRWYRAPEILVASKRYTKGIDMWSLGCILGEMLRQKPLFQGTSTVNQIERIISALPEVTSRDIQAIGASFGTVLLSKKITHDRRQTLDDMLRHCAPDAINLVKELLVFDPDARLTAKDALRHIYVERFHTASSELEITHDIVPALRDDVRVSVNEYRTKLYEMADSEVVTIAAKRGVSQNKPRVRLRSSSEKTASNNSKLHQSKNSRQPVRDAKHQLIHGEGRRRAQLQESRSTDCSSVTYRPNKHNYTYTHAHTHTQTHAHAHAHLHTTIRKSYSKQSVRTDEHSDAATIVPQPSSNNELTLPTCHAGRDNGGSSKPKHAHAGGDQALAKPLHFTCPAHRHWQQHSHAHEPAAKATFPAHGHHHRSLAADGARAGMAGNKGGGGDDGDVSGCSPEKPRRRSTYVAQVCDENGDTGGGGDAAPTLNKELAAVAALGVRSEANPWNTSPLAPAKCLQPKGNAPADSTQAHTHHHHHSYFPVLEDGNYGRAREIQLAMEKQQHVSQLTPTRGETKPNAGTRTASSSQQATSLLPTAAKDAAVQPMVHAKAKYEYNGNYNDLSEEDLLLRPSSRRRQHSLNKKPQLPKPQKQQQQQQQQQKHEEEIPKHVCNKSLLEKRETFVSDKTQKQLKLTPQAGDARYAANLLLCPLAAKDQQRGGGQPAERPQLYKTQRCPDKEKAAPAGNGLVCKGLKTHCSHHYHQRSHFNNEREHEREREHHCERERKHEREGVRECVREREHDRECAHGRGHHHGDTHEERCRRDATGGRQLTRDEDRQCRRLQKEEELEEQRRLKLQKQKRDEELRCMRLQKQEEEKQRLRELKKREEEERMERVKKQKLQESEALRLLKQQRQQEINVRRLKVGMQREEEEMIRQALQATKEMRQQLNVFEDIKYRTTVLPAHCAIKMKAGNIATGGCRGAYPGFSISTRYAGSGARNYGRNLEQKRNSAPICYNSRLLYLESEMAKYKRDLVDYVEDSHQNLRDLSVRLQIDQLKKLEAAPAAANQKAYATPALQYNVCCSTGDTPQKSPDDSGICSVELSLANSDETKGDLQPPRNNEAKSEPLSILAKAQAEANSLLSRLFKTQHEKTKPQEHVKRYQSSNAPTAQSTHEKGGGRENEFELCNLASAASQWAPSLGRTRHGYLQPGLHKHDLMFSSDMLCQKHAKDATTSDARAADPGPSGCDGNEKKQQQQPQQQQQQQQRPYAGYTQKQHYEFLQPWEVAMQKSENPKQSKHCKDSQNAQSQTAAEQCYFEPNAANRARTKSDGHRRAQQPTQLAPTATTGSALGNQHQSTYPRCQSKQANRG